MHFFHHLCALAQFFRYVYEISNITLFDSWQFNGGGFVDCWLSAGCQRLARFVSACHILYVRMLNNILVCVYVCIYITVVLFVLTCIYIFDLSWFCCHSVCLKGGIILYKYFFHPLRTNPCSICVRMYVTVHNRQQRCQFWLIEWQVYLFLWWVRQALEEGSAVEKQRGERRPCV